MKRRFIAGAVCPECRALDRIVVEVDEAAETESQRCVECGYEAHQVVGNAPVASIPKGKPERRSGSTKSTTAQTVKIMDLHSQPRPADKPK
ncbi:MAG: hypothetical protein GKR90_18585 [Pseudomonadales bacterium]|nr:hypothetical protein [Pseudomonadales bacterium]